MKVEKSELQLESVVSRIRAGEIDLQPDFQRGEIWDNKRRQRLVDTILRGWYVPAVHIVLNSDGHELVLDGQQRLATIRDLFNDEIRVDGSISPRNDFIEELDGLVFSAFPPEVQRALKRFGLQVITLTDHEPDEPNELFFRLNQSYNLTPPEKRNALHGPARDQVRSLVSNLGSLGLLAPAAVGFSNGRLAYDDVIARVCVVLAQNTLRKHVNNTVVEAHYRNRAFPNEVEDAVSNAGRTLFHLIEGSVDRIKLNKGTLQTWLIYCAWAPLAGEEPPALLLSEFDADRQTLKAKGSTALVERPRYLSEVLRIYNDRASYRVTDVSSVIARDLAVHLYSQTVFGTAPESGSDGLLERVSASSGEDVQKAFFEFLDTSEWGHQLIARDLK